MAEIHATAVIEPGAELADDVSVGPFCHIGPKVTLGTGTKLVSHVVIVGRTTLGEANRVWPYAVLGGAPQDLKYHDEDTELIVGDHNDIREGVTIHRGTANANSRTCIGNDNLLMAGVHIAHDCDVADHVIIANNTQLAGHVRVRSHANIAGMSGLHHYVTVGQYSFVGGMSRIVHDVPPFMIVEGSPCKVRGVNVIGLQRHRFPDEAIEKLKEAYRTLFRGPTGEADPDTVGNLSRSLRELHDRFGDDECVNILLDFMHNTSIGVFGRFEETKRPDSRFSHPVR